MGRKKKKQLKPWCWYPLSVGSRGRAAAPAGGDGHGEAWLRPVAERGWDVGLGVGNGAAGPDWRRLPGNRGLRGERYGQARARAR